MLEINGRPFMDYIIEYTAGFGVKRFILSTGYRPSAVEEYYRKKMPSFEILFSRDRDSSPAGTGGAVKLAQQFIQTDPFLVLNGDSFCACDINGLYEFHKKNKADISVVLAPSSGELDTGCIDIDGQGKIVRFAEKNSSLHCPYINAGIYLFSRKAFSLMPNDYSFSLEYDFFPRLTSAGFYGYPIEASFIDIGTPERYNKAKHTLYAEKRNP
jgi:NDP-sugar pyrophosphorylase family protein